MLHAQTLGRTRCSHRARHARQLRLSSVQSSSNLHYCCADGIPTNISENNAGQVLARRTGRGTKLGKMLEHCSKNARNTPSENARKTLSEASAATKRGQLLTKLGPTRANARRNRPTPSRFGPDLVKRWPILVDVGVRRPDIIPTMPPRAWLGSTEGAQ